MAKGPHRNQARGNSSGGRPWRISADSGLSIRDFCRGRGLHESAFYFWRRELTQRDRRQPSRAASTQLAFVPVRVIASVPLEVVLRSGQVVRVGPGFEATHLRAVVDALEGRPC